MLPVNENKEEKLNKQQDIYNNLNSYYNLDNHKNKCKKHIYTFIKDTTMIVVPFVIVIGTILLIIFLV